MKKTLAMLLALVMILGLCACGTTPSESEAPETTAPVEQNPVPAVISVTEENTYTKPLGNVPEVPYWFPADLLAWEPGSNPDDAYNLASIPLAERVDKEKLTPAVDTQNKDVKVLAISIMNASTSGNAPHGLNSQSANMFSYWQYIDTLVYWGGSSGEGLIVVPSADVIDVAHKNGVPVLGTVFFPQAAHGGKIEWLNDFLTKDESGSFPIVDKLIEAANYFGFDGWFINQETEGGESDPNGTLTAEHAALMQELIKEYKAKAGDDLQLVWYDSMTESGEMNWQNALTDENKYAVLDAEGNAVADSMFLNFWWNTNTYAEAELVKATAEKAAELGVDPYEMYAGIDVQANGYNTGVRWNLYAPEGQAPYTSLGLYCPSWTYFSAQDWFTDYQERELKFWVNENMDPFAATTADVAEKEWVGISTYAIEKTVVNSVPFITNFDMGHGYSFFRDGEKISEKNWNNRSMQDILPTYRWHLEQNGNGLRAIMDYGDAWYGGTSLKLYGKMVAGDTTTLKLYATDLAMTEGLSFTAKAKSSHEVALNLVVTLDDGTTQVINGDQKVGNDWTTVTFDVSGLAGKTVSGFDVQVSSEADATGVKFLLGQIAIVDPTATETATASDLTVDGTSFDDDDCIYTGVRLSWTGDAAWYEIYRVNQDGSISLIDVTPSQNLYINALERNDDTNKTNFIVVPVNTYGVQGAATNTATMDWPDNSIPKADFMASATLAAPGQEITFTSLCSANTETVTWEFPGASVETSTDAAPVVTYAEEGTYTVRVTAKNASGEVTAEKVDLITITAKAEAGLSLLSLNCGTEASAYVNDNEAPPFAVDGDYTKKWCATGNPPHTITIDLGEVKAISEVKIFHAEAGGESPDMNTKAYTILVSEDGENFTQVVQVKKNFAGESSDTFAAINARYVQLVVEKPTQGSDTAARIYEVEVYGLNEAL